MNALARGHGRGAADTLSAEQAERVRTRVRLLIEITARSGQYRKGLLTAVAQLGREEAAIIADLERHGMQVPQLHDVLCGGHVLIDDPQLYSDWQFKKISHPRISSHHHDIDKSRYPDIGMRGHVVREKLHGRTARGTWVQLEKTPAAFGQRKLPSVDDFRHLMDYVVYRVTRSNVGPWGLSRRTERRPIVLDARLTGTAPGEPWRVLLLPQPEPICLVVRIDALGVHEIGLYRSADALDRLTEWLPAGEQAGQDPSATADDLLAKADRAALVTATRYTTQGSAEIAGSTTDLVLAQANGRLHAFARDPDDPPALLPRRLAGNGVRDTIAALLA